MIFNSGAGMKQETPVIAVSESGLITATAGALSSTYQLPTQAGKTVVPINSTAEQTAVAKGRFTTGNVYVQSDLNLLPGNIKSGVSIFGVAGTLESGVKLLELDSSNMTFSKSGTTVTLTLNLSASKIYKMVARVCDTSGEYFTIIAGSNSNIDYVTEITTEGTATGVATITYGTSSVTIKITGAGTYSSATPYFVVYE